MNEAGGSAKPGTALGVIGGLMTAGGVFLTWGKAAISMPGVGTENYQVAGTDMNYGPLVMGLGIAIVLAAIITLALRGKPAAPLTAIVTLAGGLLAAVLGIMTFTGLKDAMVDPIVSQAGVPLESFNDAARQILLDAMAVGAGWGLYLSILGGCVAAGGGVLLLMDARSIARERSSAVSEASDGAPTAVPETMEAASNDTDAGEAQ